MVHLLLQSNDHRTVLDECDLDLADIDDDEVRHALLARLGRVIRESELRHHPAGSMSRIGVIASATDYRELSG